MRKALRAIRFSSVGVFFAGIIGVIQGCSVEREGALFAVLLFLLNFCSGPVAEEVAPPPPIVLDAFTDVDSVGPTPCGGIPGTSTVAVANGAFDERTIRASASTPGGANTITVGGGELVFSYSAACLSGGLMRFRHDSGINASAYSQLVIPVTALTGAAMTCDIFIGNDGVTIVLLNDEPITSPSITIDISSFSRNKIDDLFIGRCFAAAAGSFTLGPPEIR